MSSLTTNHQNKWKVDAVPFSFIICHVFHTGYVPDTALKQTLCLVLILPTNKQGGNW